MYRPSSTRPPSARPPTHARTAQSRPGTARPVTAASSAPDGCFVVALIEGRGIGRDVGIAALDKDTGRVVLTQLADCQTYVKTLHHLHLHSPSLILLPDTFVSLTDTSNSSSDRPSATTSPLLQSIRDEFPVIPIEPVLRKYFNQEAGYTFVQQLCLDDEDKAALLVTVHPKYYALSAICAIFKHAEVKLNKRFAASSLQIKYRSADGAMFIDPETARNLELTGNFTSKKSTHSLFGALNHTYTPMGARLLRMNILSPITVHQALESRLDAVEELVQTEDTFTTVKDGLKAIHKLDLDKLVASIISSEARESTTASSASARVAQMLSLRNIIQSIPALAKPLKMMRSALMGVLGSMLSDGRLENLDALLCKSLNEDVIPQKGGLGSVNARVYAVKANFNRLLDVARETYRENVDDIFTLTKTLSTEHDIPLSIIWQSGEFVFSLKKAEHDGELPVGFINVTVQKGRWLFSSMNLKKMNARLKDALEEALMLSDKIIFGLVSDIVADIGALYKASEAIALIDMLWSFAHTSVVRNYVRPEFTGTLAIKAGQHPILGNVQIKGSLVPNDVYCCDSSSFQIVQGPNMSGKSTYLRQIGLLAITAMTGCFVPAEYASFRLHDALLTRLSNDDDMEKNLSTFANEMAASAMILGFATKDSLVLVDELGRGTSPRDGVGISHAIAEELIHIKSFVFFATHYGELATTLSRKPSVVNLHLSVQKSRQSASNFGMIFHYKIRDGPPEENDHYGIELARLADLPQDVMDDGKRIAIRLTDLDATCQEQSHGTKVSIRRKTMLKLKTQLEQFLDHSRLDDRDLLSYLAKVQRDVAKTLHGTLD